MPDVRPRRHTVPESFEAELDTVPVEYDPDRRVGHLTLTRPDSPDAISPQPSTDVVGGRRKLGAVNEAVDGVDVLAGNSTIAGISRSRP